MKQIQVLLLVLFTCNLNSQIKLEESSLKDGEKKLNFVVDTSLDKSKLQLSEYSDSNGERVIKMFTFKELSRDNKEEEINAKGDKISWTIENFKLEFTGHNSATGILYYCKDLKKFVLTKEECNSEPDLENNSYTEITQVPIPIIFDNNVKRADSRRNRYLVIDGSREINYKVNNNVYKRKNPNETDTSGDFDTIFKAASLDVKGTLSVFIRNFGKSQWSSVKVTLNGTDYSYTSGLQDVYSNVKQSGSIDYSADSTHTKGLGFDDNKTLNYLTKAYNEISKHEATDTNYLGALNLYKSYIEPFKADLNDEELVIYRKIQSWNPTDLLITPYALAISDSDEISVTLELKDDNALTNNVEIGTFRTTGGLSFNVGSSLNFTGLKMNEVYTESIEIDGTEELRAKIEDKNQLSLGIGLNTEVGFRTGSIFEPTFNLGFFVPFDEEISPYLGIGPGISLKTGKVNLAFSGGIAFGKINAINERYKNIDLTELNLANTDLTSKVWDTSWFFGIGVNFVELTNKNTD